MLRQRESAKAIYVAKLQKFDDAALEYFAVFSKFRSSLPLIRPVRYFFYCILAPHTDNDNDNDIALFSSYISLHLILNS